mmetsp:Transcript_22940/g.66350  ORF Transcript_22940/g.66350 Transcript_22940/m.66350 type:complete len:705 (+) Transcript_22940:117-2231(+)
MHRGAHPRRPRLAPAGVLAVAAGLLLQAGCSAAVSVYFADDAEREGANPSSEPAISESSSKQITAVLDTLKDIIASVESEQKKEEALFREFDEWCKNEEGRLAGALGTAQSEGELNQVTHAEKAAANAQLSQTLEDLKTSIQETNDVMAQAESVRGDETDKYDDDIQLNRESLASIARAIEILQKVHGQSGLLQSGLAKRYQIAEPGESSFILGVMKGLQDKLMKTKQQLEAEEANKKSMHDSFMSIKKTELAALKDEQTEKKNMFTQNRIDLVEIKHSLEDAKQKVEELTALIKATDDRCAAKRASWNVRQADRVQELAALNEAIATIQGGVPSGAPAPSPAPSPTPSATLSPAALLAHVAGSTSPQRRPAGVHAAPVLLQVRAAGRHRSRSVGAGESAASAAALLQRSGGRGGDSTREVIEGLIKMMEKQQVDEAEKRQYCKGELEAKDKEKVGLEDKLKELSASIGYQSGQIETLGNEVAEMEKSIEDMKKGLDEAAVLRKKEKQTYEASSKDRKLAVKVLHQAMQVLKQFYASKDKAALAQTAAARSANGPPETWTEGGSPVKTLHSSVAIEMMAKVAGEIEKEEADAAKGEAEAVAAFEKLEADNRAEFDRLMEEITARVKRKAKLVVGMNSDSEAETQHKADLETVLAQIRTLHEECDELLANFDKRRQARKFELGQLRDVIDIVSNSQSADAMISAK